MQYKYIKMHIKILSIGRNVFELFCVTLYTDYLSDLYKKKLQVASTYDTNVEYQIWSFFYTFFSYRDKTHTHQLIKI